MLYPISRLCAVLSKLLLRTFGVKMEKKEAHEEFSKVDLDYLVQQSIDQAGDDAKIDCATVSAIARLLVWSENNYTS